MSAGHPGHDEAVLTTSPVGHLCNSLGCAPAGRAAEVVVIYSVLNDPTARQRLEG